MKWPSDELIERQRMGTHNGQCKYVKFFALTSRKCEDLHMHWLEWLVEESRWHEPRSQGSWHHDDKAEWRYTRTITLKQYGQLKLEGKLP